MKITHFTSQAREAKPICCFFLSDHLISSPWYRKDTEPFISCFHVLIILLSSIYPFTHCLSLLVTIICCKYQVSLLLLLLCTASNRIMLGVPLGWPNCSNWGSYNWPVDLFCSVLHLTALIFLTKSVNASIQRSNPQTPHRGRWIFMRPFQNLMETYIDRVRLKTPPKKFK